MIEEWDAAVEAGTVLSATGPFTLTGIGFRLSHDASGEDGTPDVRKYGSLPYLENGVKAGIYKLDGTVVHEFFDGMTCNCNFYLYSAGFSVQIMPVGVDGYGMIHGFAEASAEIGADERVSILIQDDLTGLDEHTVYITGEENA